MDIAVFTQNETLVESILTSVVGAKLWRNQTDGRGEGTAGFGYEAVVDIVPPPTPPFILHHDHHHHHHRLPPHIYVPQLAGTDISMRLLPLCLL